MANFEIAENEEKNMNIKKGKFLETILAEKRT